MLSLFFSLSSPSLFPISLSSLFLFLSPGGKFSHMPRRSKHCCANPTKTGAPLCLSLLPNLTNPLEIATCGREAAQLIYVASEALTWKREATGPLTLLPISRAEFVRGPVTAIISSNLSAPLAECFFIHVLRRTFGLPFVCIQNCCGLFRGKRFENRNTFIIPHPGC